MQAVLTTFLLQHDLRLIAVAASICAISAYTGISLLNLARASSGVAQKVWLLVAALAVGFGIWSTHFVAMLSFDAGIPLGYDIRTTLVSLGLAVLFTGTGFWFAALSAHRRDIALGGAVVGLGIGAMHYVGMAAIIVGGQISWDSTLLLTSALSGIALAAAAVTLGTIGNTPLWRLTGAGTLVLAIVAVHLIGMGAAGFENGYAVVAANDTTRQGVFIAVGASSVLILCLALGALFLELRARRIRIETSRMRSLADAAVEGLMVCEGRTIVTVNSSFLTLIGMHGAELGGRLVSDFLTPATCATLFDRPNEMIEGELATAEGKLLPVEVVLRPLDTGGQQKNAIAVRDLSDRKEAERHIRFLAHNDTLTGLPNRTTFNRELESEITHAKRHVHRFAVLALDLDRFKDVNDLYGHAAGDVLLQRVATALQRTLGEGQFAARLGGDEFAVIIPDVDSPAQAGRIAEQILEAFQRENAGHDDGALISASIGIALFPNDAEDAEHLTTCADTALYRAKLDGRGVYRFYETEMGAQVRDRRQLEHDLRLAISRNQLRLVYQPQVMIDTGEVTGFEALARWDHPQRGPVEPSVFIPIAEESALILLIGEWVLREACSEAARWANPLQIAVNVSAVQIHSPQLYPTLMQILVQTGLSPERLELEVTESALVQDMPRALSCLRQIKALGVKIAMDDFGTGYSSLSNLRAFPFDRIKIDRSFTRDVDSNAQSAAIVRAVVGLGRGLDLPVVIEGVESAGELDFLRDERCAEAQGYWFSRPESIEAFHDLTHGAGGSALPHADDRATVVRKVKQAR